ncbi:BREX system serine/threonine kinase PglW [Arthrobacter gengyunqii]|uniref:non-specific serine/threonine protein kinase n=1 Tax=Arthrobacter gengyunqii TaxID=2886940 RepID=A0A9X1M4E4_9MICC|nr:BREX system serine/threonine kinase PglW [Arthrobacter gengyunqii]MCC3270094.1 BREX system serine/threonine kinase PglW [Arthrobacter gengyunqii]UOY96802.1 BREX system serine/threonine kinase PglW [Arthrobacter gengyunqii]
MEQNRWVEVSPSQFAHETEGLHYLKAKLPDTSPYRVWSNFEFRDERGGWHEVDALLLGRGALHLLELKYYSGRLTGNDTQWLRAGKRAEASPLLLARRKAQYLASKLKTASLDWGREKGVTVDPKAIVPFVNQAVFLHHPGFSSELPASSALGLYGLDENENTSHLPGISTLINEPPRGAAIGQNQEILLVHLMERIGFVQRREREAGSWIIEDGALDEGPDWQDWRGYHKVAKEEPVRIRFQMTSPGAAQSQASRNYRIAEHEYRLMSRLSHDGLLRPRDLVDSELGVGLVYDHSDDMQRLDLWMAEQTNGLPLEDRLSMIRQLSEALDYAHRNQVVHRGLSPKAVWVKMSHGQPKVLIGGWQSAGLASQEAASRLGGAGVTSLFDAAQHNPNAADAWLTEAFEAPEGRWRPESADRIKADLFSLGALAYYILTGKAPSVSSSALKERLRTQHGLDLSLDLPEVSASIRSAVLDATRPAPGQRLDAVSKFVDEIFSSPQTQQIPDEDVDAVDAVPGAVLAHGRFKVLRRLGKGSTAVGLLVEDANDGGTQRVLKVALDAKAAQRLHDEAAVLRALTGSRLVRILEGPLMVGDRSALLLESAGEETLSELLRSRKRLSLDLLERFGRDLLESLVQLDKAGIDHRDIKPGNLGVRAERSGKHLVLFDFSLSRAAASDVTAGTPPYLDPFLGGVRSRFDSAAERYSAAVVLFEMASGHSPYYGDPLADPASVTDEVTIAPGDFDPAVSSRLETFFRTALARDAKQRHDTATEMLEQWRLVFPTDVTTAPANADELVAAATVATLLERSGLSARALSAVEPLGVATVGELLAVDPVRLTNLSGVAQSTRREVSLRAKTWRQKFGESTPRATAGGALLPSVMALAEMLIETAGTRKAVQQRSAAELLLGVNGTIDAFATQAKLGAHLPNRTSAARANQIVTKLQNTWAENPHTLNALTTLSQRISDRLEALGNVASVSELASEILAITTVESEHTEKNERIARGLLRLVIDRGRALRRADADDDGALEIRRREGIVVAVAKETALLDAAERLGREADALLQETPMEPAIVPAERARQRLTAVLETAGIESPQLRDVLRLTKLSAGLSHDAAASGTGELHPRSLSQPDALRLALSGVSGPQRLSAREIADRVRVRFPAVPPLPAAGRLAELLREAQLDLVQDPTSGTYGVPTRFETGSGSSSRLSTATHTGSVVSSGSALDSRLRESATLRSFLALGARADRCEALARRLETEFNARRVDVTALLLDELKKLTQQDRFPSWDVLVQADAQTDDQRATRGLAALVGMALPAVEAAITDAASNSADGRLRPVLIVEAAPLVRYGHGDLIRRWSDLATPRGQAVWIVLPQFGANQGPLLDGFSVQSSPNQFIRVDPTWIDAAAETDTTAAQGATA